MSHQLLTGRPLIGIQPQTFPSEWSRSIALQEVQVALQGLIYVQIMYLGQWSILETLIIVETRLKLFSQLLAPMECL